MNGVVHTRNYVVLVDAGALRVRTYVLHSGSAVIA